MKCPSKTFSLTVLAALVTLAGASVCSAQDDDQNRNQDQKRASDQRRDDSQQQQQQQSTRDDDETHYLGRERAALGVQLSEDGRQGVRISRVIDESPADDAGLRRGDRIRKIDGQEVRSYRDIIGLLNRKRPDDDIRIGIDRDGESKDLKVTLQRRGDVFEGQAEMARQPQQGGRDEQGFVPDRFGQNRFQQRPGRRGYFDSRVPPPPPQPDPRDQQYGNRQWQQGGQANQWQGRTGDQSYRTEDRQDYDRRYDRDEASRGERPTLGIAIRPLRGGLSVTDVFRGSAADRAGVERGDLLVALNGQAVQSFGQLVEQLQQYDEGEEVTLDVVRNGERGQIHLSLQGRAQPRGQVRDFTRRDGDRDRDQDRDRDRDEDRQRDSDNDRDDNDRD